MPFYQYLQVSSSSRHPRNEDGKFEGYPWTTLHEPMPHELKRKTLIWTSISHTWSTVLEALHCTYPCTTNTWLYFNVYNCCWTCTSQTTPWLAIRSLGHVLNDPSRSHQLRFSTRACLQTTRNENPNWIESFKLLDSSSHNKQWINYISIHNTQQYKQICTRTISELYQIMRRMKLGGWILVTDCIRN